MRYLTFLFVLCVTTAKGQQTTLSFKVKDSLKRQIVFFEPIDGHANRAIPTHTIENDNPEDKTFTRIIKIEKPVAIEVFFGYLFHFN